MAGSWNRVNHFIIEADQMTHPIHWNPMAQKFALCLVPPLSRSLTSKSLRLRNNI